MEPSKAEMHDIDWLYAMADYRDMAPRAKQPFVRTKVVGHHKQGCFICGKRYRVTRHHIVKGSSPVVVFLQWKYHQIIHGVGLKRFKTADIRTTYAVAEAYNLWKREEANVVKKKILAELERRSFEENSSAFFNKLR